MINTKQFFVDNSNKLKIARLYEFLGMDHKD